MSHDRAYAETFRLTQRRSLPDRSLGEIGWFHARFEAWLCTYSGPLAPLL